MLARSRHERYLGSVALRMDSLLPEFSIVVKVDLGIHCHDLAIGGFGQRVHLNHGTVTLDERVINGLDLLFGHGRRLSASELHLLGDGLGFLRDSHVSGDRGRRGCSTCGPCRAGRFAFLWRQDEC